MRVTKTKKDFPINAINNESHRYKKKDFPINSINNESHQNKKRLSN